MSSTSYQSKREDLRSTVEVALSEFLRNAAWPESLKRAVQYSVLAGGKRLRPILVLLSAEICGGTVQDAVPAACAIEMIHTYSLIHDDLPAMDDDDFRRGRPTSHKVFGEALAILAGDCLLTAAFEIIAASSLTGSTQAGLCGVLATAAGGQGMVGGQILDLEAEKNAPESERSIRSAMNGPSDGWNSAETAVKEASGWDNSEQNGNFESNSTIQKHVDHLTQIHTMKTGALITAALEMGAICGNAEPADRRRLREYGQCIGLAFQIADDLLDVTGDNVRLGKETGRDSSLGKLTFPALLGVEQSRQRALDLVQQACGLLEPFGAKNMWLKELARFIVERDH